MRKLCPAVVPVGLLAVLAALSGCTARHYRQSADKEAAAVIAQKTPRVPNMDTNFTIEAAAAASLTNLPVSGRVEEFFGADGAREKGARVVSLEAALDLAVKHNRTYQTRKEVLYLAALDLTLVRYQFTPIFSGGAGATHTTTHEAQAGVDAIVEERSLSAAGNARMDVLLRSGARLATEFSATFFRFFTGDSRPDKSSQLAATLTQPLLRGAGYKVTMENLTQAERDLLYDLRDFTLFRKQFSVDIAAAFYGVLQNRDAVRNSWRSLQSFRLNVERSRALAQEGRLAQSELDRILQAELTTETAWVNAVRTYRQNLDRFKIQLGLSGDVNLVLDDLELTQLRILHPALSAEEAAQVAVATRLDLYTRREQVEDAVRFVGVAANALRPGLDLITSVSVPGNATRGWPDPDWRRYQWSAGLDLELPLDRKGERNTYRFSLIARERATRELDLAVDNVKLDVYNDWRTLDQARRNYDNSVIGVKLSERRVEEQQLRAELGLGKALDLVDAQNALLASKNDLTAALVSHTIARLRFWQNMGILFIKDNGQWENVAENK